MLPINDHSNFLGESIFGIGMNNSRLLEVSDQLTFASGIRAVEFDTESIEGVLNSDAAAMLLQREDIWCSLAREISIFLLVWSALECYINELAPKYKGIRGKINNLCEYLNKKGAKEWAFPEYAAELANFKSLLKKSEFAQRTRKRTLPQKHVSYLGEGIYQVYAMRNVIAHGELVTPWADEVEPDKHPDVMLVTTATRLVLFTIQFMILADYDHDEIVEIGSVGRFEGDEHPLSVGETFTKLHIGRRQFRLY